MTSTERLTAVVPEMLDLLTELEEFLDNYVDVNDGDDGQLCPNRAMSLTSEIQRLRAKVKGERWPA